MNKGLTGLGLKTGTMGSQRWSGGTAPSVNVWGGLAAHFSKNFHLETVKLKQEL